MSRPASAGTARNRRNSHVVVLGDALLDRDLDGTVDRLAPDAPVPVVDRLAATARPGGAALAASLIGLDDHNVTLITALGRDEAGRELVELLTRRGVQVVDLGLDGATPEKVRVRTDGRVLVRLDYGGRTGAPGPLTTAARDALTTAAVVLVSDYGRGMTAQRGIRDALATAAKRGSMVWDPHPRGSAPVPGVRLATPNLSEAARLTPDVDHADVASLTRRAHALVQGWEAAGVVITLGERGALLVSADGTPLMVPAPAASGGDPCGAGDRFAARAATALADGALLSEAVIAAVDSAAAFVMAGGAGGITPIGRDMDVPSGPHDDGFAVVERTRAAGGTAVATGGCFDLLHAGHVQMLQAARDMGDCLVVCINSDDSVRRLKGPDRPVVNQADRAAVLSALACVDAVVVFDEDTPEALLRRLRPDVWAKGADYAVADLPEAAVMAEWGGQAVVLPYLRGRSTSRLIQEVTRHANQP